ncbi:hypothetical protein KGF57_003507 [Candida theae]|uniref:Sorting nexin MVP1 n=1 Tax=Candida theae TaxID=1198502 RepID=A0AAD5BCY0_9ASCO|nr:uncharacterized protein KGF57_003507 [Candida theae]KAI5956021.1 hypothetical protein KGF57_003507 [Candida theae]
MSSSIFNTGEEEDPWSSTAGWNDDKPVVTSPIPSLSPTPYQSTYLTSSQLLNQPRAEQRHQSTNTVSISNVPASYESLRSHLLNKITTINDFEYYVFDKLIDLQYLTSYQKSKILDIVYDNNLVPVTLAQNFYQILGLVALEIDVPGSGDFVTLQFKLQNLPELPQSFLKLVAKEVGDNDDNGGDGDSGVINDPLRAMANTSRTEDNEVDDWNQRGKVDPILTDHSDSQHQMLGDEEDSSNDRDEINPQNTSYIEKYIEDIRDEFKPLILDETPVKIRESPEKEGLLFKHINYTITHNLALGPGASGLLGGHKKVVRRYSDFAWLLEYLLQKYPFRVIPGLPPKKFTDSQFLQRRRRGLHRFLNQLVKHPVFRQEPIVQSFLTVPSDLATWKKQAKIDYSIEFKGQKIQTEFINIIWPAISEEFLRNWALAEQNIRGLIEKWTKLVILVERHEKRQQQMSYDNQKFVEILNQFRKLDTTVYPQDDNSSSSATAMLQNNDVEAINAGLTSIGEYYTKSSQVIVDDSYTINTTILEKLKNYMDYLYSLLELFERSKNLSGNQIDTLNKRIKENELNFKKVTAGPTNGKEVEINKLRQSIINDKQEIFQQLNRDWLIKQCCFKEYVMFQETQYLVSEVWVEWCRGRHKFQEKLTGLSENLSAELINDMPLSR